MSIKYLNQEEATKVDKDLMDPSQGFINEQLMELAGLSVAVAIYKTFPLETHPKVLVIAGPGNNGGDGLVCSRHLYHFGYKVTVVYPKKPKAELFQCLNLGIEILENLPDDFEDKYDQIVDAIFGYSFKGDVRSPFDKILNLLAKTKLPISSVDIPSGWDVEKGPVEGRVDINPKMLISLTAPKLCAKKYQGIHWLGGRFVPKKMAEELNLPKYEGTEQVVLLK